MQIVASPDNDDQTGGRLAFSSLRPDVQRLLAGSSFNVAGKNVGSGIVSRTVSRFIVDVFYLKSLSLEVIFSSRLEMWYEALAMLVLLAVSLLLADCVQVV